MMKEGGYSAESAGAIEAVASTGGQLMPPVMGAVAFIMADFLSMPYREIVIAALVPSFLYYVALFFQADLEAAAQIPLRPGSCAAVLVFRYLHRPLARGIVEVLAPGGLLLYETFTLDQRKLGYGPKNEGFLLKPNELAGLFPGLETLSYWEGTTADEKPAAVARLVARRG